MKRRVLLVVVAVLAFAWHSSAETEQADSVQQAILGTWSLDSYVREEVPSGAKSDVMGAHPSGYINYGRDGRMMVMIVGGERKKPAGAVATPEEAQALMTSMLAYGGTYKIDTQAKIVVHHIDISWDQARTGTDQVRSYKLEGKRITLTTEPSADPATGKKTVRMLVWEKLE
jgi:hypothetical protein